MKQCLHCSQVLPLDYFWPSYDKRYDKIRYRNYCKDCGSKYNKTRYSKDDYQRENPVVNLPQTHFVCTICKENLPADAYYVRKKKGRKGERTVRTGHCLECRKIVKRTYMYDTTVEYITQTLESQNRNCAICRYPLPKVWHLDHNHTTNQVRGILCSGCNTAIGHIRENIESLKNAIDYLEFWNGGDS